MDKTIKDKIYEAYSAAWDALKKSLTDNGVKFDDADSAFYVNDPETKTTWFFDIKLDTCEAYYGDAGKEEK